MVRSSRRLGMTKATIVAAATALTREHGLDGWNQRQLTAALDTSPSVVFHHVGDRQVLNAAVVEQVLLPIATPGPDVPWDRWFREVWLSIRPLLDDHRGVAHWMLHHGPIFDHMLPFLDEAMGTLFAAGFGEEAPLAYSLVFNTMTSWQVVRDERADPAATGLRTAGDMAAAISAKAGAHPGPGARALLGLLGRYAEPDADLASMNRAHFAYTLDRVLDGLAVRLDQLTGPPG